MLNFFYSILIQPLIVAFDVLYTILYGLIEDPVLAILALSIVINFLILPLYCKADLMQREEIEKARKMKPWLDHIRRTFSGDERFMMQSAYYKIEHYNPLSVLKEAGPLALQIPFFMAAYRYISAIPLLETASFGPINNLLAPDGLLIIGGVTVNILPIIMTLINCVSGYIYSKDGPARQKIQIYGIAVVFLVLLYNSASGVVIYWIMNQIFSLGKNIVYARTAKHARIWKAAASVAVILLLEYCVLNGKVNSMLEMFKTESTIGICAISLLAQLLYLRRVEKGTANAARLNFLNSVDEKKLFPQTFFAEIGLALLMGFYIPSSVLASSAIDFVDRSTGLFPYNLLWYPALIYTGLLVVWMTVMIFSRDGAKRRNMSLALWLFLGVGLVNQFLFDPKVGILYATLLFSGEIHDGLPRAILNILACTAVACGFLYLFVRKPQWMKRAAVLVCAALAIMSAVNVWTIHHEMKNFDVDDATISDKNPLVLSRNGQNVIVFMLDRAMGSYVPYILDEKPELKDRFEGFTYYEDTLSFGLCTNYGSPAIFGGYEYSPAEINKRDSELLRDKHNEALKVMPVLFRENGYHVTVCDVPCANYRTPSDLSIYDEYPDIDTYMLEGKYTAAYRSLLSEASVNQQRNFVMYSVFRTVPLFMKQYVYDNGGYISLTDFKNTYSQTFLDSYAELAALPEITDIVDREENHFLMMQNATPHEPVALNPPDYAVDGHGAENKYNSRTVDGRTLIINSNMNWSAYCVNVATLQAIADWLDYMRVQGVYDNTRIILVADHGYRVGQFEDLKREDGLDVESFWPLLMVKDFDTHGPLTTSNEFMTNADVPTIAMKDIILSPVNPFTGNLINSEAKKGILYVTDSWKWGTETNNGTTFDTSGDNWWTVHDSIFDLSNWTLIDYPGEEGSK